MSKHIFWLSSYPKSGNTLLRSILIPLFFTNDGIFDLKMISKIVQFEEEKLVYENRNIFKNDLEKIKNLNVFYKYIIELQKKNILNFNEDFKFFKSHSGNFGIAGHNFTKEENIRGYIYLVRDPRDVCISWSKHMGITIDESIKFMTNDFASLRWNDSSKNPDFFNDKIQPAQLLSSWDKHVISWVDVKWTVPRLIIKYEDLVYKKKLVLDNIISFFQTNYGFKFDNLDIKKLNIIKSTSFNKLKKEEKISGFKEKSNKNNNSFFSVGEKNQWEKMLSKKQIDRINNNTSFRKIMNRFNYEISS
tara:strand:- start:55 stop:966 length:912 start_codon:yes stop_codon:yes gene_type:complete